MEPTELKAEAQEMFNVVVEHLRKQNAKSEREADHKYCVSSICCYRSPDGKKCAIGCLIPDEEHDPKMDENAGSDIDQLIKSWLSVPLREKFERHVALLSELQYEHDTYRVEEWEARLAMVASRFELVFTPKETT